MSQDKTHGEGNYEASKDYNERTKRFVQSGQVEQAAEQAAPHDAKEAAELEQAEAEGKRRAKGEDPQLRQGGSSGRATR